MKKLFSLGSLILLFFLAGFLSAVSSFIFQVFLSNFSSIEPFYQLFLFVLLEELFKFVFWKSSWALAFFPSEKVWPAIFLLAPLFAGGFWFLEMIFLKLKNLAWQFSLAGLVLFFVHWLTTWLLANANQKYLEKKYGIFLLIFLCSLAFHLTYNWLIEKGVF